MVTGCPFRAMDRLPRRSRGRRGGRGRFRGRGRGASTSATAFQPNLRPLQEPDDDRPVSTNASASSTLGDARTTSARTCQTASSRFSSLPIAPELCRAMKEVFEYETMTTVQNRSIPVALTGADVLVKARTGTGKTLSFLIPTLNRAISAGLTGGRTSVLIISPTRELAQQIATEAKMLMTFVKRMTSHLVVGGTNIRSDLALIRRDRAPTVLIATPGRLLDHLGNKASGFRDALQGLMSLVLDEADRLLDMGFAPDLRRILAALPPTLIRQTLLFSATMPEDVNEMAKLALRPNYNMIDCVGKEESTHVHVPQSVLVTPIELQAAALGVLLMQCMQVPDYKIIVFFATARLTGFFAHLFKAMGKHVLEIHSRMPQYQRNNISNTFRVGMKLIMFTSDITARGLDYPNVSTVIQVGLPSNKEQYIHRIGRTARAGKSGSGVLLLADFEAPAFEKIASDLPLQDIPKLPDDAMEAVRSATDVAVQKISYGTKAGAFQAWLGFYNGKLKQLGWSKERLAREANDWAIKVAQLKEPPSLLPRTVRKMGLQGVPQLRVDERTYGAHSDFVNTQGYRSGNNSGGRGGSSMRGGWRGGSRGRGSRGDFRGYGNERMTRGRGRGSTR